MRQPTHEPVLTSEILALFKPGNGDRLLDATVGLGGHARAFLEASAPDGTVVGIDADAAALEIARGNLAEFGDRVTLVNANFANLKDSLASLRQGYGGQAGGGILAQGFTHVLFDLGVGSHQLADVQRGYSFRSSGPLSMLYGQAEHLPSSDIEALNFLERRLGRYPDAADIVAGLTAEELAAVIWKFGEERHSRRIARAIKRAFHPTMTASQVAETIRMSVPARYERGRIHSATRTFQALRLAVNRELEALRAVLPQAVDLLKLNGMVAVISFHSLEDRIVKQFFKQSPSLEVLTKRPIRASEAEVARNPRSRSAKLRAARKAASSAS